MNARLKALRAAPRKAVFPKSWRSILSHTHMIRGRRDFSAPQSYQRLAAFCAERGIDALGIGSPYTPATAKLYRRYDEREREIYYGGGLDKKALRRPREVAGMLRQLNRFGRGRTLFFLDNETPKGRYGHLWWIGWKYDFPPWHDYDQPFDRWAMQVQTRENDFAEPMPYRRRPYLEIVAGQRAAGAMGFWAHPTSWWRSGEGRFATNIASELPVHLLAEGFVDGMAVMGYSAWKPDYLGWWFHFLDRGYRVLGVAEADWTLSTRGFHERKGPFLTWYPTSARTLSVKAIQNALKRGNVFCSSGPFLRLEVDGHPMGASIPTSPARQHRVIVQAQPGAGAGAASFSRVEIVGRGGRVLGRVVDFPGGSIEWTLSGSKRPAYLLARAFGAGETRAPRDYRTLKQFAVTNPVYLRPKGARPPAAMRTRLRLDFEADSPWEAGTLFLESPAGEVFDRHRIRAGRLERTVPANARLTLQSVDGVKKTLYLVNANRKVQAWQRYLYRGRFLRDFPRCRAGEVPPEALRLGELKRVLARLALRF